MAVNPDNVIVNKEDWEATIQQELDEPNKWRDICTVVKTSSKVVNNPYGTDMTVQTGERGTPYTYQPVTLTNESVTINTYKVAPQVIDRADLAQSGYVTQMMMAKRQGVLLNEAIETDTYLAAGLTAKTLADLSGGGSGSVIVSALNVDDIMRMIIREVQEANGESWARQHGGYFSVWKPSHFEHVIAFAQANGYVSADDALKRAATQGFEYFGITHYTSNLLPTDKMICGAKGAIHLYLLKDTYGKLMVDPNDPGQISGVGVVSRVDYKHIVWNKLTTIAYSLAVG